MKLLTPLAMLFISLFLVINIISQKIISCLGIYFTVGDMIFPFMYLISVILTETYGYQTSRTIIWSAFGCNLLASSIMVIAILLPANSILWSDQTSFSLILGRTPRLLFASFTAFLTGEFICANILTKLNKFFNLKTRSTISTLVGHLSDSLMFSCIAFAGTTSVKNIIQLALSACIVKILVQIILLPLITFLIQKMKQFENI